jgi:hypothetical protein
MLGRAASSKRRDSDGTADASRWRFWAARAHDPGAGEGQGCPGYREPFWEFFFSCEVWPRRGGGLDVLRGVGRSGS